MAVDKAELKLTNLNKNPVAHLHACIADHSITADYIICCGDLGHRADQQGIRFSWNFLNDLQLRIGAKATFATVGNHDVDSRFKDEEPNPFEFLKGLNPAFPFSAAADFDKYWSRNFTVTVDPPYRYLVLNTCSSHGYEKEYERGLVSPWTLGEIRKVLSAQDSFLVNILVAHHHPHRHTELGLGDQDDIKGGDALMQLLSEPQFGKWLVIHGHKHHAKIAYAKGDSFSPTVFSAGSFSACLNPPLGDHACNQFYILTVDADYVSNTNRLCGEFQSWSWSPIDGWVNKSFQNLGLPPIGGFGFRDGQTIAKEIEAHVRAGVTSRQGLISRIPELNRAS